MAAWLDSSRHLTAELGPVSWTFVAAERVRDGAPRMVAAATFADGAASLQEDIRQFRTSEHLPSEAALVYWPARDDRGVAALGSRSHGTVSLPKARVIRERVAPFVRGGGYVRDVLLPHEAVGRLVALGGWSSACVLVMDLSVACLAVVEAGVVRASYLGWSLSPTDEGESSRLLTRYQLAARLVPNLRDSFGRAPNARMAVCGRFPDLRSAMLPVVEELDREVDVLDAALVGRPGEDAADPDDIIGRQLAWAVAAGGY